MISVIVSVNDQAMFNNFFMPVFNQTQETISTKMELIVVEGTESLFDNYRRGQAQAKHIIKAYVHQDVNLMDPSWLLKVITGFAEHPDCGLIGFCGTTKLGKGMWWESGKEYIRGDLWSGKEKADWALCPVSTFTYAECVDSYFMASNRIINWNEKARGFFGVDMETARQVMSQGYKIGIVNHKAWHIGAIRPSAGVDVLLNEYYARWNL